MGQFWLTSLPDVLRNAGLSVSVYDGWETRARSTGGYDGVWAVEVHHTASNASPASDMAYCWTGSPDRPVGAVYLARSGHITVGAAGATNTSGKGGPRTTVHGEIPLNAANKYVVSIEAANDGVGEAWPQVQQDAYVRMVAAINAAYGLAVGDVHAHFEWTDRKKDPAGNSKYATGGDRWDMDAFRGDVWLAGQDPTIPPQPPSGKEIDMIQLDLNPGTDWWVACVLGDTDITHIVNGHHANVLQRGGVPAVTIGEQEMDGILRSVRTTNASPFKKGLPSWNQALDDLWNAASG